MVVKHDFHNQFLHEKCSRSIVLKLPSFLCFGRPLLLFVVTNLPHSPSLPDFSIIMAESSFHIGPYLGPSNESSAQSSNDDNKSAYARSVYASSVRATADDKYNVVCAIVKRTSLYQWLISSRWSSIYTVELTSTCGCHQWQSKRE